MLMDELQDLQAHLLVLTLNVHNLCGQFSVEQKQEGLKFRGRDGFQAIPLQGIQESHESVPVAAGKVKATTKTNCPLVHAS